MTNPSIYLSEDVPSHSLCQGSKVQLRKYFNHLTRENDLIINMGAGDCHDLWQILTNQKN